MRLLKIILIGLNLLRLITSKEKFFFCRKRLYKYLNKKFHRIIMKKKVNEKSLNFLRGILCHWAAVEGICFNLVKLLRAKH